MKTSTEAVDYDVIIVGARCAGAATARLLADAGLRVLVVDRGTAGSDSLSTSYLMRGAVLQLHRWGLLPRVVAAGTPPVRRTVFHYAEKSVHVDIREVDRVGALYAPRRTVLDPILVEAARQAGAEVRYGVRVHGLLRREDGRVCGVRAEHKRGVVHSLRAHWVIGADGLASSVARFVDAPTYHTGQSSEATIYGHFAGFERDHTYHWYYARGMAAGVAPTNDGLSTVFVSAPLLRLPELSRDRQGGMIRAASELSELLAEQLWSARRVGLLRGFIGARGYYRKPFGPGWALVGDAGYFRDPCTAHGISDALRDAELLARALIDGRERAVANYQSVRDVVTRRLFDASDAIASGTWDDARIEALLLEASKGMRDSTRVIESWMQSEPNADAA